MRAERQLSECTTGVGPATAKRRIGWSNFRGLSRLSAALALGLIVSSVTVALREAAVLESVEMAAYDLLLRYTPSWQGQASRIVLVGITERDIQRQQSWPLPDSAIAAVLERLLDHEPSAVGLDIYRDVPVRPGTSELSETLATHHNVIAVTKFESGQHAGVAAPAALEGTDRIGFNDVPLDSDGSVRRGILFMDDGTEVSYSFALRLALKHLEARGIRPEPDRSNPEHIRIGQTTIPPFEPDDGSYVDADARGYQFLLDFRDARGSFPSYTLAEVLDGRVEPRDIKDSIAIVGVTAESVKDYFITPHSRYRSSQSPMSGIELHAAMTSQLLRSALHGVQPISILADRSENMLIVLWGLLGAALGLRASSAWHVGLAMGGLVAGSLAIAYIAFVRGWWIPMVPQTIAASAALVTAIAYVSRRERIERRLIMNLFSRHVSHEIAEEIWRRRQEFMDERRPRPQRMHATVLFTDLQAYTTVAEQLDPVVFMDWLNEYMEAMTPIIVSHQGVIIRFFGDSIMAAFGVPLRRRHKSQIREDACNAVRCALGMERKLSELNHRWGLEGRSRIGMRIGIQTGPVITGSLGDGHRLEFNVQGDTVNTASRLESFEKQGFAPDLVDSHCRVLIGEATNECLDDSFQTERVGELTLKGKTSPVMVHTVLTGQEQVNAQSSL